MYIMRMCKSIQGGLMMSQNIVLWALLVKFFEEVGYCREKDIVGEFRKYVKTQTVSQKRWSKKDIRIALKSGVFTTFTLPDDSHVFYTLKDENTSKNIEDARQIYGR